MRLALQGHFAYDSIDKRLIQQYFSDFYQTNPDVPPECRPSLIHVLDKHIYARIKSNMKVYNSDGSESFSSPPLGTYDWFETAADLSAMAFMFMELQQRSFMANHMLWKYGEWIDPLIDEIRNNP